MRKSQCWNNKSHELTQKLCSYHEDVDEAACVRVPHLQCQVVSCCDDHVVMAIPGHHGDLEFGHFVLQGWRVVLPDGIKRDYFAKKYTGRFNLQCFSINSSNCIRLLKTF